MRRFDSVLIANRGEIAVRIARTCRQMGLWTVAAFSDADRDAPHVRAADEAIRIGPAPAADSYLDIDALLAAAGRCGVGAIHPGYGFLAERAAFAQAVEQAGLVFIGPPADVLRVAGSKALARCRASEHGIPVLPGYAGSDQSDAQLIAQAEQIGFPLLVKASAGGGGKGMHVVRSPHALPAAIEQARRIAVAAFGVGDLLLERYLEAPRHLEVQIVGDLHGGLMHLYERDCSVQRRFQKLVEETPAPGLSGDQRHELCETGLKVGRALGYVGAGTVEFLAETSDQGVTDFYFLEVNARLQVEHPITEAATGLDLVRLQILVAQGAPLPVEGSHVSHRGHAIECRLCAEDPQRDDLPATGTITEWDPPESGRGAPESCIRVDSGVEAGSEISVFYDSLLAKIIVHAPSRAEALLGMSGALRRFGIQGVRHNLELLRAVVSHPAFEAGRISTHFLEAHRADLRRVLTPEEQAGRHEAAAWAATLYDVVNRAGRSALPGIRPAWRNSPFQPQRSVYTVVEDPEAPDPTDLVVEYTAHGPAQRPTYELTVIDPRRNPSTVRAHVVSHRGSALWLEIDGRRSQYVVCRVADPASPGTLDIRGPLGATRLLRQSRFPTRTQEVASKGCAAPMPGKVVKVLVTQGQSVSRGDPLVILEAMKMEHTVTAPTDGRIGRCRCAVGDLVKAGHELVVFDDAPAQG